MSSGRVGGPAKWPLVGREAVLAELRSEVGAERSVVVRGQAGVGKSRLLGELAARLAGHETEILWLRGVESTANLPLAPLLALLPPEAVELSITDLVRRCLAEVYRRRAAGPVVILVDDGHLVSEEVAVFVHQVCTQRLACTVVAARRTETLAPAIDELARSGIARSFELAPLSIEDTALLLAGALDAAVDPRATRQLWALSQGHPLYLRELTDQALEAGVLRIGADGAWRLTGPLAPGPRVVDLLADRLEGLSSDERGSLALCAVQETIPRAVLEEVTGVAVVAGLVDRGLLREHGTERRRDVRAAHPLYAEVAAEQTEPGRRRALVARLAEAWAATGARRSTDDAIAVELRLAAGDDVPADQLLAAARTPGLEPARVDELARLAHDRGAGPEALFLRAEAATKDQRWNEATELYELAFGEADAAVAPTVARRWLRAAFESDFDVERVFALGDRLADAVDGAPDLSDALLRARMFTRPLDPVRREVAAGLRRDPPVGGSAALGWLLLATVDWHRGALDDALAGARRALADPGLAGLDRWRAELVERQALLWLGRPREASAELASHLDDARVLGHLDREAMLLGVEQSVARLTGRLERSVEVGHRIHGLAAIGADVRLIPQVMAELALSLGLVPGRSTEAAEIVAELAGMPPSALYVPRSTLLLAEAHLAAPGGEQLAALRAAAEAARERNSRIYLAEALHHHWRRLGTPEPVAELEATAAEIGGVAALWAEEAVAGEGGDLEGLVALSRRAESLGVTSVASESAARAAVVAAPSDPAASHVLRRRWRRLAVTVTPSPPGVPRPPALLTDREDELLDGAIDGATDRDLADRHHVSVRTVQGHLHRAYRKLGVDGRTEVRALVGRWDCSG